MSIKKVSGIINDFLNIFCAERFDRNLAIVVNMLDQPPD